MNKDLNILVDRLNRIFPHLTFINEGYYINEDVSTKTKIYDDSYCPPYDVDWYEIIKILNENGLTIIDKKDCQRIIKTYSRM